jgi:hypothetical protein
MTVTISRRDQTRPLHPRAKKALRSVLRLHGHDECNAHDIDTMQWVTLGNGRRELRDTLSDVGLFTFVNVEVF